MTLKDIALLVSNQEDSAEASQTLTKKIIVKVATLNVVALLIFGVALVYTIRDYQTFTGSTQKYLLIIFSGFFVVISTLGLVYLNRTTITPLAKLFKLFKWVDTVQFLTISLLIVLHIITFYVFTAEVFQSSMNPTLQRRHLHRHAGIAQRADLEVADILLQQVEAVEGEKDLHVPAQCSGSRAEDEGRVGPIERAFGRDDGHRGRLGRLQFLEFLRQDFVEALADQRIQGGLVGGHVHDCSSCAGRVGQVRPVAIFYSLTNNDVLRQSGSPDDSAYRPILAAYAALRQAGQKETARKTGPFQRRRAITFA